MVGDLSIHQPHCLDRILRGDQPPDAVLLLGAGASVKSGVPLAGQMVSMAAKWAFCVEHGLSFDDPSITLSDWKPWLSQQGWYDDASPLEDQYPQAMQRLLRPRESRRRFFLRALASATRPSPGYEALAKLVAARRVRHVLTVNFDDLFERTCSADRAVLHVASIRSPDDLREFSTDPLYPQVIYLHGSVGRYQDCNLEEETRALDEQIREAVLPVLRDHPLVVIGYRGAEASVMLDLLHRGAETAYGFRHGVYWCVLSATANALHPYVLQLAERLGTNFRLVEITGFDDALSRWAEGATPARIPEFSARANEPDIPDLRPVGRLDEIPLDTRLAEEKLNAYAQSLGVVGSTAADTTSWERWLTEIRLVRSGPDGSQLTRAGRLLFARDDVILLELRSGETFVPIAGNVFEVLDKTLEAIEDFNEPYRLKGPVSQDVRRFDRRAVKELIVNALAHRDYDDSRAIRLGISRRELTVASPGGLVGGLTVEQLGQPHARAYRNHIVADVLYGTGAMDKKGSGLADVLRWTRQAGGEATFGLSEEGQTFIASLRARDVDPDPDTGTATAEAEHFTSNVLEAEIVEPVQSASSPLSYRREIYELHPGESLPGFAMQPGRITTFSDLGAGPLARHVRGDISSTEHADMNDPDAERMLVQLLNSTVLAWARRRGLRSDAGSRRLWFPRDDDGAREVTYRARVREATRTVTKAKVSRSTGDIRYWEHEAVRFRFRRYDDSWALHLTPCFVFTRDGYADLLTGPRVGPLATRRAARDFNPQVENDLYFWLWVLTDGQPVAVVDDAVRIRWGYLSADVVDAPTPIGAGGGGEGPEGAELDDLEEPDGLTEEIAAVAADIDHDEAS